jgi:hypothetical protein
METPTKFAFEDEYGPDLKTKLQTFVLVHLECMEEVAYELGVEWADDRPKFHVSEHRVDPVKSGG